MPTQDDRLRRGKLPIIKREMNHLFLISELILVDKNFQRYLS